MNHTKILTCAITASLFTLSGCATNPLPQSIYPERPDVEFKTDANNQPDLRKRAEFKAYTLDDAVQFSWLLWHYYGTAVSGSLDEQQAARNELIAFGVATIGAFLGGNKYWQTAFALGGATTYVSAQTAGHVQRRAIYAKGQDAMLCLINRANATNLVGPEMLELSKAYQDARTARISLYEALGVMDTASLSLIEAINANTIGATGDTLEARNTLITGLRQQVQAYHRIAAQTLTESTNLSNQHAQHLQQAESIARQMISKTLEVESKINLALASLEPDIERFALSIKDTLQTGMSAFGVLPGASTGGGAALHGSTPPSETIDQANRHAQDLLSRASLFETSRITDAREQLRLALNRVEATIVRITSSNAFFKAGLLMQPVAPASTIDSCSPSLELEQITLVPQDLNSFSLTTGNDSAERKVFVSGGNGPHYALSGNTNVATVKTTEVVNSNTTAITLTLKEGETKVLIFDSNNRKVELPINVSAASTETEKDSCHLDNMGTYSPSKEADELAATGTSKPIISTIQVHLKVSPADSDLGPATRSALCKFQENNGLTADGKLNCDTYRKLTEKDAANFPATTTCSPSGSAGNGAGDNADTDNESTGAAGSLVDEIPVEGSR